MKSKIAIVGGGGFIGKNLRIFLSQHANHVKVISRRSMDYLPDEKFSYLSIDIRDSEKLISALSEVQTVIWLAHSSIPSSADKLEVDFQNNISPVVNFLEKATKLTNLKQFIYFSSGGTVYGDVATRCPIDEFSPLDPISTYGFSKLIVEKYIAFLTRDQSFESIILRPSNIFGPYQNMSRPQGIIGFALDAIIHDKKLLLYDGGMMVRDFIYVDDVSRAVVNCISTYIKEGETTVYNLGSGEGNSVRQVINIIEKVAGRKLNLVNRTSRNFDCQYNVLECSKLATERKWSPETPLKEGIEKVYDWFIKNPSPKVDS